MNTSLWASIMQTVVAGLGMVVTAMISVLVPRAIAAFETRTGIQLTAQQEAKVLQSAMTAKGILETKLDQRILTIDHIDPSNPAVLSEAAAAIARVPAAAAALGKTTSYMAETIVGMVDTARALPPVSALGTH
jgi:hypothetical protein